VGLYHTPYTNTNNNTYFHTHIAYSKSVMIAQWDSSRSVPPYGPGSIPGHCGVFQGFFPGWSHSANPSWASVAENLLSMPHTMYGERREKPKSNHEQTMADWKKDIKQDRAVFVCSCSADISFVYQLQLLNSSLSWSYDIGVHLLINTYIRTHTYMHMHTPTRTL